MGTENNLLRKKLNNSHTVGLFFIESLEIFSSFTVIDNENVEFYGFVEKCDYNYHMNVNIIYEPSSQDYGLLFEFTDNNTLSDTLWRTSIERYIRGMISTITNDKDYIEIYFINYKITT